MTTEHDTEGRALINALARVHYALLQLRGVRYFPASEFDIRKDTLFLFPGKHPFARDRKLLVLPWRQSTMPPLFNHVAKHLEKLKRFQPFVVLIVSPDAIPDSDTQKVLSVYKTKVCVVSSETLALIGGSPRLLPRGIENALAAAPSEVDISAAQEQGKRACAEIMTFFEGLNKGVSRPTITISLLAASVAWFGVGAFQGVSMMAPTSVDLIPLGAMESTRLLAGQYWRLLSASFVHVGILHLAINMFCLYVMGPMCEKLMGHSRFLILYLLSGVGGFLTSVVMHGDVISAGASASIFGVAGGILGSMLGKGRSVPRQLLIPTLKNITLFFVLNLSIGLSVTFVNIDNAAHAGGFFSGLLLGGILVQLGKKT